MFHKMSQTVRCNLCNATCESRFASDIAEFVYSHQHALLEERPESKEQK